MTKIYLATILTIVSASSAYAETDWTPKLTLLQDSCSTSFHIMDDLQKKYQNSIVKKSEAKKKNKYDVGNDIVTTYQLKDATAFGLPIEKFQQLANDSYFSSIEFSIFFKDSSFLKLRPSFYYKANSSKGEYFLMADNLGKGGHRDADSDINIEFENTATGYDVSDESGGGMSCNTILKFDKSNNSLSCSVTCD